MTGPTLGCETAALVGNVRMLGTTKQAEVRDVSGVLGKGLVGRLFTQLDSCSFRVHDELRAGSMREAIAAAGGVSRG